MRIVAGKFKGYRIHAPHKIPARPTTDRAKESLFNILNNQVSFENLRVLDLFSGTGNMAYEFASRGAELIHCVDQHPASIDFIKRTFTELEYPEAKAFKSSVMSYLQRCRETYNLIFADPPYDWKGISRLREWIMTQDILEEQGLFILEHATQVEPGMERLADRRIYGQSAFSIYQK